MSEKRVLPSEVISRVEALEFRLRFYKTVKLVAAFSVVLFVLSILAAITIDDFALRAHFYFTLSIAVFSRVILFSSGWYLKSCLIQFHTDCALWVQHESITILFERWGPAFFT
jgi:hypothetical protein